MDRSLSNPLKFLFLLAFLYAATRYCRIQPIEFPSFIAFHFTDLLFIPMQLTICLVTVRLVKRDKRICIPVFLVFTITGLMAVLFEWYLPVYKGSLQQTADATDVLMYFIGAVCFLFIQSKWLSARQ